MELNYTYLTRGDRKACICKRKDCRYMAKTNLPTCDYMLMTGMRRGCPVKGCTKYAPGHVRRNLPLKSL